MSVPNPIVTDVCQTDTYGNDEFYGWDVSTEAGYDQRMCPRYEAPGKGEVDEQAGRRQRRAAKKKVPVAASHGGVTHNTIKWCEKYMDADAPTSKLRVETSVTQDGVYGGRHT